MSVSLSLLLSTSLLRYPTPERIVILILTSIGDLRESGGLDDLLDELSQSSLSIIISAIEQLAVDGHLGVQRLQFDT